MSPPLAPLARFLLWDYDRGSVPYDVLVAFLVLLMMAVPGTWWGDPMVSGR